MAGKAMGKSAPKKSMATTKDPVPEYVCPHCGKTKKKSEFYVSTDPAVTIGVAFPCKDCSENIARRYDPRTGEYSDMTEASLKSALMYLDKPFVRKLWESAYNEVHNENLKQPKKNMWTSYIKNVTSLSQYRGDRWRDGDFDENQSNTKQAELPIEEYIAPDVAEELERNRRDVVRLVGYDPFEKEQLEDKPLLYAQTVGYLDMSGNNDDAMRTSSVITIVRGFLQIQKLDDMIAQAMINATKTGTSGEIKAYLDAKQKISSTISQLAEQNCISLKHNKNNTKGENTWTGKVRIMKEMNLREAEVNIFDAETASGLAQVADISNASILKQISLDENDYVQMLTEQKKTIEEFNKKANEAIEKARLLLRENIDLKKLLEENDIDISEQLSKDTILYEE
jgi:hypothetical protein